MIHLEAVQVADVPADQREFNVRLIGGFRDEVAGLIRAVPTRETPGLGHPAGRSLVVGVGSIAHVGRSRKYKRCPGSWSATKS